MKTKSPADLIKGGDATRIRKFVAVSLVLSLVLSLMMPVCLSASAQPKHDEFHSQGSGQSAAAAIKSVEDNPVVQPGALAMGSNDTPVVRWFEQVDSMIARGMKTPAELATLSQGLNQELERVEKWTRTANKVATRYKGLAAELRKLAIPAGYPGLKDYLELTADWYDDAANVYLELLRPRKPSQTMEELDARVALMKDKASSLKTNRESLRDMDVSLRKTYRVHMPRYDDAIQQYVRGSSE